MRKHPCSSDLVLIDLDALLEVCGGHVGCFVIA